jgi:ADP-dependent NAD(P)H-hydrate dehydratase / NAD(P)H-hydrate epimerase
MDVVTSAQMREREQAAIAQGVTAEMLMERAGVKAAAFIITEFPAAQGAVILLGKGNNAGDGIVVARELARAGWKIIVQPTAPEADWSDLPRRKWRELHETEKTITVRAPGEHTLPRDPSWIIVDAMLGLGAQGTLKGEVARWVRLSNETRKFGAGRVVALDCPSGLSALVEKGEGDALVADLTIAMGSAKDFLVQEEWSHYVGRLLVAPIFENTPATGTPWQILDPTELAAVWPRRSSRSHKGNHGKVVIIGGSAGLVGATVLASRGALGIGAGLVYWAVPDVVYSVAAAKAPDEVMVIGWKSPDRLDDLIAEADALVIGPGMGTGAEASLLLQWILPRCVAPVVLDADALTLVAQTPALLNQPRGPVILTPHLGEMRRLLSRDFSVQQRVEVAREYVRRLNGVLVLKGVRTVVAQKDKPLWFNSSGNAGLARGGAGDILSGMLGGLLGQGLKPLEAAQVGVWVHGRAADVALRTCGTEENLSISRLPEYFGTAIQDLRSHGA